MNVWGVSWGNAWGNSWGSSVTARQSLDGVGVSHNIHLTHGPRKLRAFRIASSLEVVANGRLIVRAAPAGRIGKVRTATLAPLSESAFSVKRGRFEFKLELVKCESAVASSVGATLRTVDVDMQDVLLMLEAA